MNRPEQGTFVRTLHKAVPVLTVVFWIAAAILVVLLALPSFVGSTGVWLTLLTGISMLVVVSSSGALAWVEFRSNPMEDAERGEWTNRMLFYGLVFAITFFVAFLYWVSLYFSL
ncbi:MAG TPA: hypothetical protein VFI90_13160 [Rubrobacter sp.]|nr:hypothetical protein [Rubrobacter sp.]